MIRVHGFYGHIKRNDLRSAAMFLGFVVALQLIAAVVLLLPLLFFDLGHAPLFPQAYLLRYGPFVFVASVCLFVVRFRNHVASVRESVAFTYVERRTNPRLVNIVETLAIAAGLPLPKVGLIETSARNAFACGLSPASAVVVVTRGLVDSLDDAELSAVVAHEIAHIDNGDIRLMAAANVLMEIVLRLRARNPLQIGGWKRGIFAVLFTPYLFVGALSGYVANVSLIVARLSRLLIASSREFVADAEAVRLTQNPEALVAALRKIEGRSTVMGLDPQADAMMIDGATSGAFATHPTIADRIAILTRLSTVVVDTPVLSPSPAPAVAVVAAATPSVTADGRFDIASWRRQLAQPAPAKPSQTSLGGLPGKLFKLATTEIKQPALLAMPRQLVERVNEDVKGNPYGVSPGAKRIIAVAMCILLALQLFAMFSVGRERKQWETAHATEIASGQLKRAAIQQLSTTRPAEARCFATDHYAVGDRGRKHFHPPKPELVEAYASGRMRGESDVSLERYLGYRVRALRTVAGAKPEKADDALREYVMTRKLVLELAHRFYGEEGLEAAQAAYDNPLDRIVLTSLRERRKAGAIGNGKDAALGRDIDLLTSRPDAFVPCVAREASNRRDGAT